MARSAPTRSIMVVSWPVGAKPQVSTTIVPSPRRTSVPGTRSDGSTRGETFNRIRRPEVCTSASPLRAAGLRKMPYVDAGSPSSSTFAYRSLSLSRLVFSSSASFSLRELSSRFLR